MNAGFIKRIVSTIIDLTLVLLVIYGSFALLGRNIMRNQIDQFDVIYPAYNELLDAYNEDLAALREAYQADVDEAGDNDQLAQQAEEIYQRKADILSQQNSVDIEPYNDVLSRYFMNNIYYFALGVLIVMTLYAVLLKGKTLGRRIMQLRLEGPVSPISVFFHDVIFKYFFIILALFVNVGVALLILAIQFVIDMIMIVATRRKLALRDMLAKIRVVKAGYGY